MRNSLRRNHGRWYWLWFVAYLKWETVFTQIRISISCCDLMLIWNEKQWKEKISDEYQCCDLMLIWNEKQSDGVPAAQQPVVIWCLFEMRNSWPHHNHERGVVVIWCLFEMRNSRLAYRFRKGSVVIWCLFEMRNSADITNGTLFVLWFDAYLKWETVGSTARQTRKRLWFDAYLKWETVLIPSTPQAFRVVIWCLFEMRNSFNPSTGKHYTGCDLMLIWNEKQ